MKRKHDDPTEESFTTVMMKLVTQFLLWVVLNMLVFHPKVRELMKNTKQYEAFTGLVFELLTSVGNWIKAAFGLKRAQSISKEARTSVEDRVVFQIAASISAKAMICHKLVLCIAILNKDTSLDVDEVIRGMAQQNRRLVSLGYFEHLIKYPEKAVEDCPLELKELNALIVEEAFTVANEHLNENVDCAWFETMMIRRIINNLASVRIMVITPS